MQISKFIQDQLEIDKSVLSDDVIEKLDDECTNVHFKPFQTMKQDQLALVLLTQTRVSVGNLIRLQQILLHFC